MLVVEDGSGLPEAGSYADAAFAEAWLTGERRARFLALDAEGKEDALASGTRYVDLAYRWAGKRKTAGQALSWPREGVVLEGFPVEGVPAAVRKAACEAAFLAMTGGEGLFSADNGRVVTSESVSGAVSVSYGYGAAAGGRAAESRYEVLDLLLRGLFVPSGAGTAAVGAARVHRA